MSRRGDNIHKRKDGRWEGRYQNGRKPDGSLQYASVYGKTYREVRTRLLEKQKEMPTKQRSKDAVKTFAEVLELWLEHNRIRLKGGTMHKYQSLIDAHIRPELGAYRLSALSSSIVNGFLLRKLNHGRLDRHGGLSASYVRSMMLVISAALKFAAEEGFCMPLKTPICKPSVPVHEITVLTVEEQKRLERGLSSSLTPTHLGIWLSLYMGLRLGEVCGLMWSDIDFQKHVLHVRRTVARVSTPECRSVQTLDTPKTGASVRDIPLPSALLPLLTAAHRAARSEFVTSEKEGFLSPRTYEYRYRRLMTQCGLRPIHYHALRHTFATRCIEAGVDVKSLSEILGHANVGITLNTYVHSSMELKRVQLEKLCEFSA